LPFSQIQCRDRNKRHQFNQLTVTVRTGTHKAMVDITQQCSSDLSAIHDEHMIKHTTASDVIICKAKVNMPGTQCINVLNDVIQSNLNS
jgi:hypothetical protein